MALGPKRNAPLKRAGKPQEGSRRNSRDTGGEKTSGDPAWPAVKKTFARRDALRSCPHSGDRAAAAGCPRALKPRALRAEVPHPFCGSGPAGRGVDQGTRFYRSGPVRREASGARCEPAAGDVRSARAQLTADRGRLPPWQYPFPARRPQAGSTRKTGVRQEIAGLHPATDTATDTSLYPGKFSP